MLARWGLSCFAIYLFYKISWAIFAVQALRAIASPLLPSEHTEGSGYRGPDFKFRDLQQSFPPAPKVMPSRMSSGSVDPLSAPWPKNLPRPPPPPKMASPKESLWQVCRNCAKKCPTWIWLFVWELVCLPCLVCLRVGRNMPWTCWVTLMKWCMPNS